MHRMHNIQNLNLKIFHVWDIGQSLQGVSASKGESRPREGRQVFKLSKSWKYLTRYTKAYDLGLLHLQIHIYAKKPNEEK